jgi:acetolactate decarboxylase
MKKQIIGFCLGLVLCSSAAMAAAEDQQLFQVQTLYTLEAGLFEGDFPYSRLMTKGDFGLGTFNSIDGEMVALDGKFYQSTPECRLKPVEGSLLSPFAEVISFKPTTTVSLSHVDNYKEAGKQLLKQFPYQNLPYAIRIDGVFKTMNIRSLTKQSRPYPSLLKASKKQGTLNLTNVKGTLVGFWFPHYWEGIGMPTFHFHFISADHQFGGHVLGFSVDQAQAQLEPVQNVQVYLPNIPEFTQAHLPEADELEEDLLKAEGGASD